MEKGGGKRATLTTDTLSVAGAQAQPTGPDLQRPPSVSAEPSIAAAARARERAVAACLCPPGWG